MLTHGALQLVIASAAHSRVASAAFGAVGEYAYVFMLKSAVLRNPDAAED